MNRQTQWYPRFVDWSVHSLTTEVISLCIKLLYYTCVFYKQFLIVVYHNSISVCRSKVFSSSVTNDMVVLVGVQGFTGFPISLKNRPLNNQIAKYLIIVMIARCKMAWRWDCLGTWQEYWTLGNWGYCVHCASTS